MFVRKESELSGGRDGYLFSTVFFLCVCVYFSILTICHLLGGRWEGDIAMVGWLSWKLDWACLDVERRLGEGKESSQYILYTYTYTY